MCMLSAGVQYAAKFPLTADRVGIGSEQVVMKETQTFIVRALQLIMPIRSN